MASKPHSLRPAAGPRVTIMDVAKAVGLSRSATAYALKDDPHVSKETRDRVKSVARQLGYRADPMLAKLMAHLHAGRAKPYLGKIAFINSDPNPNFVQVTPALRAFFNDAKSRAFDLGYETEMFWLHEPGRTPQRLARMLLARGIRGILMGEMEMRGRMVDFPFEHFAMFTMGYSIMEACIPRVVPHHHQNTVIAMDRVMEAGYRRPGLLTYHPQEAKMGRFHIAAFLAYQQALPAESHVTLLNSPTMTSEVIRDWFVDQKPDVILTTNFPADIHFKKAGIRVPRDVALVSLLRWDEEEGIAGVRPGYERMGTVAINQLVSALQHDERGLPERSTTIAIEGVWVDGPSMPAPARPAGRGGTHPAKVVSS